MANLTKKDARKIADKLGATVKRFRGKHERAIIMVDGSSITTFGIRRGSKKDAGHDFIASQLHVRMRQAKDLAECPMSRDQWIDVLREKGLLP